jgi:transposase
MKYYILESNWSTIFSFLKSQKGLHTNNESKLRIFIEAVIPSKSNYKKDHSIDWHVYKERHLIENFFSKIKHFRRIFSRFDKTCSAFLGFISLASIFIWLR